MRGKLYVRRTSGGPPLRAAPHSAHTDVMTGPGGPTGDDRPPDPSADGPGDEQSLALSIPDDARELDADITAYRKELRARQRRERLDRYTLARYWRPYGIPFPV